MQKFGVPTTLLVMGVGVLILHAELLYVGILPEPRVAAGGEPDRGATDHGHGSGG